MVNQHWFRLWLGAEAITLISDDPICWYMSLGLNELTHWGRDNIFRCNFLNENVWIPVKISLKFVPKGPIKDIPALVQIMAWRRQGEKPLSKPMMVNLPTHICITRPQWVNQWWSCLLIYVTRPQWVKIVRVVEKYIIFCDLSKLILEQRLHQFVRCRVVIILSLKFGQFF